MRYALLSALIVALVACTTSPTGRQQFIMIGESQMAEMGVAAFTQMKQQAPTSRNRRINDYVQCVTRALIPALPGDLNNQNWEVVVFANDEPNAFALPGGKIGVHEGILKVARNQHQLAAVIGHEIAHVEARHGAERVSQQFAAQTALGLVQTYTADRPQQEQQMVLGLLGIGAQVGILLPFSRTQEAEADALGVKYMARAGFDPQESIDLWQNMKRAAGGAPPEFLSTHPHPDNRIRGLERLMPQATQVAATARRQGQNPNCRQ